MIKFDLAVVGNRVCFQVLDMFGNHRFTGKLMSYCHERTMSNGVTIGSFEYPAINNFLITKHIWLQGNKRSLDNNFCTLGCDSSEAARKAAEEIKEALFEWATTGGFYPAPAILPVAPVAFCSTFNF